MSALTLVLMAVAFVAAPTSAVAATGGYCSGSGVNVVIDFGALGGGVQKGCGTGHVATDAFNSAGFAIGHGCPGNGPGWVSTVAGQPTDHQSCGAGGQGYWGFFITNPGWTYATLSSDSQPVGAGQTISYVWQTPADVSKGPGGERYPSAAPAARTSSVPSKAATPHPAASPSAAAGGSGASASTSATATTSVSASASGSAGASNTTSPTPFVTPRGVPVATLSTEPTAPAASSTQTNSGSGGVSWWIPTGIVVLLGAGAGAAWWRQRAAR